MKLGLITQFPALNEYKYFKKIDTSRIELFIYAIEHLLQYILTAAVLKLAPNHIMRCRAKAVSVYFTSKQLLPLHSCILAYLHKG